MAIILDEDFHKKLSRKFSNVKMVDTFGGQRAPYVDKLDVINRLNETFGLNWTYNIISKERIRESPEEDFILVHGRFRYTDAEGVVHEKDGIGSSTVKRFGRNNPKAGQIIDIGNNFKSASTDALKKCVALCGVALDLSMKAEPITDTQKTEIIDLFQKAGHTPDKDMLETIEHFNTDEAEQFIDTLKSKIS